MTRNDAACAEAVTPGANRESPRRVFLERTARERMQFVAALRDRLARPVLTLIAGYSFKTNPRAELVRIAKDEEFFAEVISAQELGWAERHGFARERIIANGPEPLRSAAGAAPLGFAFADSLEAFARNAERRAAHVAGVRLRPSMIASRFGVPVDEDDDLAELLALIPPGTPAGVSFHARRGDFHGAGWRDVAGDVLERAVALQRRSGREIVAFDVGGGWTPAEFDADFEADMTWLAERLVRELPACRSLLFEPGQAVCTPTEALVTRVLEVRRRRGRRDAIIDLAYSDWPQMHEYVHRLSVWRGERWVPLGRGPDRLGGRTCLEYDLVDGLRFPDDLAVDDMLLIADAGSYDHSMAFSFAAGERGEST